MPNASVVGLITSWPTRCAQIMFVLYHYWKAAETYNAIRCFIAAYVWMTGFGNFSYFMKTNDFSVVRLFRMLFRLNFLVFFVCWAVNTVCSRACACGFFPP
jgi:hypothetical protein